MPDHTSRLLIDEDPLIVLPSLALAVGLEEAMFLQQLHFRLRRYGKLRDGKIWLPKSYDEWHEEFPFWSVMTIRRLVGALEKRGVIVSTREYNRSKMDQTKWYALDHRALDQLVKGPDQVINLNTSAVQDEHLEEVNLNTSVKEEEDEEDPEERMTPEQLLARFEEQEEILKRVRGLKKR